MSEGAPTTAADGRGLRIGPILAAGLFLTLLFMVLRFPYERLGERVAESIEAHSGARVVLGEVSLGIVRWAPGLVAEGVRIQTPSGSRLDLDRVGLRPALGLGWLRGDPVLAAEAGGSAGRARGVLTLGERGGFQGRFEEVVLGELPSELLAGPVLIDGVADADIDVRGGEEGREGQVSFQARDGVLQHPKLPLPLPYQSLNGEIELGGESLARIRSIDLESPLANGRATGTIGRASNFQTAPLNLEIELTVSGGIRGSLNAQGVEVGRDGKLRLSVMGTPSQPIVR